MRHNDADKKAKFDQAHKGIREQLDEMLHQVRTRPGKCGCGAHIDDTEHLMVLVEWLNLRTTPAVRTELLAEAITRIATGAATTEPRVVSGVGPLPNTPTKSGESWEVVETTRAKATRHIDDLIDSVVACDCGHAPDGLKHYDAVHAIANARYMYAPGVFPSMLAEAVTRLAAIKAGAR
ncbi:hypothetical protein [Nocardia sp. NPDC055049]